ncbi:MAG: hypothetical protein AAB355_00135 [Patescibacteria group bacterium]
MAATEFQKRVAREVIAEMAVSGGDRFDGVLFESTARKVLTKAGAVYGSKACHLRKIRPLVERGFANKVSRVRRKTPVRKKRSGIRVGRIVRQTVASIDPESFREFHRPYMEKHEEDLTLHMTAEQLGRD